MSINAQPSRIRPNSAPAYYLAGPPACGSPSPPAAGRRRAPEPWPFAGQVSDQAGQAGTAARRSAISSAQVANATSLNPHRAWGTVLMVLSFILLILALIAWASRATVIGTFVLALLVIVAQTALAAAGENSKWIGGLHALDGMVILLLSLWLAITAGRRRTPAGHAR